MQGDSLINPNLPRDILRIVINPLPRSVIDQGALSLSTSEETRSQYLTETNLITQYSSHLFFLKISCSPFRGLCPLPFST